jgi:hypothetical protein
MTGCTNKTIAIELSYAKWGLTSTSSNSFLELVSECIVPSMARPEVPRMAKVVVTWGVFTTIQYFSFGFRKEYLGFITWTSALWCEGSKRESSEPPRHYA